MTEQKSLKKNALYNFTRAFLALLFPVITFPYASRILGPENIGKVNFSNSIVSYFVMLSWLGIQGYAAREAAKVRHDKTALSKFVKEILTINSLSTVFSYTIFVFTILFVPKLASYRILLLICSLKILFTSIGIDWLYTALEEVKYTTIRSFFFQIISLLFLFVFVHNKDHIIYYAIFGIISSVGSNICNLIHSHKYINYLQKTDLHPLVHIKPIIVFMGISFATSIYVMLDSAMLGFLSTDIQIGFYSAANKLNHMVLSLLSALVSILLPRLTIYVTNKQEELFSNLAQKSISIMILLSLPMATGLFLLSKPLTLLFSGVDYLPAVLPMRILTPIVCAIPVATITAAQMLPALNKEKAAFFAYVCAAILNIIFNLLFIPKYGAIGAALGTLAAEIGGLLIQIVVLRKFVLSKTVAINFCQALVSSSIMFLGLTIYLHFVSNLFCQIIGSIFIGIIIYASVLTASNNKLYKETIKNITSKILYNKK